MRQGACDGLLASRPTARRRAPLAACCQCARSCPRFRHKTLAGKLPYHPRDLAALYLYGMLHRLRSSRQLEGACHSRLDVIWLMRGQTPDHSTIAEFVRKHGKTLGRLLRDTLQALIEATLAPLSHVAIDGSKVEADAGKSSVRGRRRFARGKGAWTSRSPRCNRSGPRRRIARRACSGISNRSRVSE